MTNTPSSIVCFKNGFSFVCVPVTLTDASCNDVSEDDQVQNCVLGPLPDTVVHGTIGLQPDKPDNLRIISISRAPTKKQSPSKLDIPQVGEVSLWSILSHNLNKDVKLHISGSDNSPFNPEVMYGKIKWVQNPIDNPQDAFVIIEKNSRRDPKPTFSQDGESEVISDFLIHISKIKSVESASWSEEDDNEPRIVVRYHSKDKNSGTGAVLSYLTRGLTWAPSYAMVLDKANKTLSLEGKACLLCDLSFMETGDIIPEICLVAGQPNMLYQNVIDPLVSNESAAAFINKLEGAPPAFEGYGGVTRQTARRSTGGPFSQALGTAFGAAPRAPQTSFGANNVEDAEAIDGGEAVEDFFHYILKNVPVKYNHPISMDFITAVPNIKYEDVYFVNLNKADMENKGDVEVKHAISFKNVTGQPLTTAPATVLAKADPNSKFLVQGMMKYTGPGQDATLEITTTMDVRVKFGITTLETTKEREMDNPKNEYMISTTIKKGEVELFNNKAEMVKCKVEYQLQGEMLESDPAVKDRIENNGYRNYGLNSLSKQIWEINVNPKEKKKISFKYNWKERFHAGNANPKQQFGGF